MFQTVQNAPVSEPAPDGSLIFPLVRTGNASVGTIEFQPDRISQAIEHRLIEEIWYVLDGSGQIWRRLGEQEAVVDLAPGTCITIPPGTRFQFRTIGSVPLRILMMTIPPWPGDHEALPVEGYWQIHGQ